MSTSTQFTAAQAAIAALADNSNIVPATHRAAETAILTYAQAVETTQNEARSAVVNSALNRPSIRPSLLLDLTSEVVDPRITYVRNDSAKTYFDRNGVLRTAGVNEWPLEFDPVTGQCLGRSVWEARTNVVTHSSNYNDSSWVKSNIVLSSSTEIAPDGITNATIITKDTSDLGARLAKFGHWNTNTQTGSFFVKANTHSKVYIDNASAATLIAFDLSTGTIEGTYGSISGTITPLRNGWFRITATHQATASQTFALGLYNTYGVNYNTTTNSIGTIDGASVFVWGAQLEVGSFASPYIPTTTTAVLRNAENASITGSNFSNFYNQNEGTFFVSANHRPQAARILVEANDGINANRISILSSATSPNKIDARITSSSVNSWSGEVDYTNGLVATCLSYANNDSVLQSNINSALDNTTNIPTGVIQLEIGKIGNTNYWNGFFKTIAYYPKRLANTEIQQLTTTGLLAGTDPDQLPTLGDLGTAARFDVRALLAMPTRQELTIVGTGASQTVQIRRHYAFNFAIEDSTGSTVITTPTHVCAANTDHALVFNAPVGRILTYSITPIIPS